MTDKFKIPLSAAQLAYLKDSAFLSPDQSHVVATAMAFDKARHIAFVTHDMAEDFRTTFAQRYTEIGAGKIADAQRECAMLLDLIESFATE